MSAEEKSVLIVDADQDMCWLLQKVLQGLPCKVAISNTWEAAEAVLAVRKFDLVLLDIPLEELAVPQILGRIEERQPQAKTIVISSYKAGVPMKDIDKSTKYILLYKPFAIDGLLRAVSRALGLNREGDY